MCPVAPRHQRHQRHLYVYNIRITREHRSSRCYPINSELLRGRTMSQVTPNGCRRGYLRHSRHKAQPRTYPLIAYITDRMEAHLGLGHMVTGAVLLTSPLASSDWYSRSDRSRQVQPHQLPVQDHRSGGGAHPHRRHRHLQDRPARPQEQADHHTTGARTHTHARKQADARAHTRILTHTHPHSHSHYALSIHA